MRQGGAYEGGSLEKQEKKCGLQIICICFARREKILYFCQSFSDDL